MKCKHILKVDEWLTLFCLIITCIYARGNFVSKTILQHCNIITVQKKPLTKFAVCKKVYQICMIKCYLNKLVYYIQILKQSQT